MARYLVRPFAFDSAAFNEPLYAGDDEEEAAGAVQQHLADAKFGLMLVDRETGRSMFFHRQLGQEWPTAARSARPSG